MVTLLARHPQVATTVLDEARNEIARSFCPHELSLTRPASRLDLVHNAAAIGDDVTLNYLRYGDEVHIVPGLFEDFFLVQVPLAGRARVKVGDRVVASDRSYGSLGSPTLPVDMVWETGCEQLLVYLRRSAVEEVAAAGEDLVPVVFDPLMNLTSPSLRAWLRLVHLAVDDLDAGAALLASPLAALHVEQTLIAALLAAQPNSTGSVSPSQTVNSRAVRSVMAAIEANPERPWRLAELARHAGVSARTLQEAFQRDLGSTPLKQLQRVRLERARRDLLEADPTTTTVTDVASKWGFFHLGRFSQTYRAVYQELPSHTLAF